MTASARDLLMSEVLMPAPGFAPSGRAGGRGLARLPQPSLQDARWIGNYRGITQGYVRSNRVLSGYDLDTRVLQGGDGLGRGAWIDPGGKPEQDLRAKAGLRRVGRGRADAVVGGDPHDVDLIDVVGAQPVGERGALVVGAFEAAVSGGVLALAEYRLDRLGVQVRMQFRAMRPGDAVRRPGLDV